MSVWSDQAAGFLDISESSSSEVWKHFLKNRHTEKARCKTCKTTLSCRGGTTTTLKKSRKNTKNSDFEYPDLGHWYSVTKMVRIYPDFG